MSELNDDMHLKSILNKYSTPKTLPKPEEDDDLSEVERIRQKYLHLISPADKNFSASKSSKK